MRISFAKPSLGGLLFFVLTLQLATQAQQPVFIHLQSENKQAFKVNFDGSAFTSTSNGYLIVPKVFAGLKQLSIQFLNPAAVTYQFELLVQQKPQGFSIREGVDHQLSLFDLLSMQTLSGSRQDAAGIAASPKVKPPLGKVTVEKIYEKISANGIDQVYVISIGTKKETIALFIPNLELPNTPPK